jgi:hypothetical protein
MPTLSKKYRRNLTVIMLALLSLIAANRVHAQQYHVDQASSTALTKYLHRHRLPLVGAQVLRNDDGNPKVSLYGFVAADSGRADAERKVDRFLGLTDVPVTNSIQVNPSINAQGAGAAAPDSTPAPNSNRQWNNAMQGIYKNGAQPLPSPGVPVLP